MTQLRKYVTSMVVALTVGVIFFSGCSLFGVDVVGTFEGMSPTQKAAYFMDLYNTQYDDYVAVVEAGNLSEDQKKVLRTKKEILEKLYTAIETYDTVVSLGETPSDETEEAVLALIDQIVSLVEGGD